MTVSSWVKQRMGLVLLTQVGVICNSNIVGETQNWACTIDTGRYDV